MIEDKKDNYKIIIDYQYFVFLVFLVFQLIVA